MKKTAGMLVIIAIASKILGFLREMVLAYFYGASGVSDVYLISISISATIFGLIATGISTGYIPMYTNIQEEANPKEANKYTSNIINLLMVICVVIVVLGLIFTEPLVRLFASGFKGETLKLAVSFTRVSLFNIFFTGLVIIFGGFLQIKDNFLIPALIGFPMNIIIILSIIISHETNVIFMIVGSIIATASQFLLMVPSLKKEGYHHKMILNIKNKYIKKMGIIAIPVIIGSSVNQINTLVDRTIASRIAIGGISHLNYSNKLSSSIISLFVLTIATVIYPSISKMAAKNNIKGVKKSVEEAINTINILIIPSTIGIMIFATPLVVLLFDRGEFTDKDVIMTSSALFFYTIGTIGFALRQILTKVFYAMQDTKTPVINASIGVVINIVLNIILSIYMGISGLALATSIAAIVGTILLFISLRKKIGAIGIKNILKVSIKSLSASIVMAIIAKLLYETLVNIMGSNISVIIAIGVGGLIYSAIIYFMKIEEIDSVVAQFKSKFSKS